MANPLEERTMHVQELARRLGAAADPSLDLEIDDVGPLDEAGPRHVTFLSNPNYAKKVKDSKAGAILIAPDYADPLPMPALKVANPYLAFARAIELFHPEPAPAKTVHPTAIVGKGCRLGKDVTVGAYAVLGDHVVVGDRTVIHPHAIVYRGAVIGEDCVLHSLSVVREDVRLGHRVILQNGAIVGADGFGFAPRGDGTWHKMRQAGTAALADDVEVQANACVDRATVGATTVGKGTKIDNLVQVGHGCRVGENTLLCGQSGLAGSTHVGDRTVLAGQAGSAGHLKIGNDVQVAAQAGVLGDVPDKATYAGTPAIEFRQFKEVVFYWGKMSEFSKRLKALERNGQAPAS
jgi:UDP-3-O-[3-hydroxymyristoyl] glucosamine N-acyltransferase